MPILTTESLLEKQTKIKNSERDCTIDQLSYEVKQEDYP